MSQKTKSWRKKHLDWANTKTFFNSSPVRKSVVHKKINYDLLNGRLHMEDVAAIINPESITSGFIPDKIQHYPIMNSKLDVLRGEELRRPFEWRAIITNPNAVSEIETKNMINFTELNRFDMTISLHSQGQEIYWNYLNYKIEKAYEIGKKFEKVSNYLLTKPSYFSSFAGYKDWFIEKYRKPGYTIEIGKGEEGKPLKLEKAEEIYSEIEEIYFCAIEECQFL